MALHPPERVSPVKRAGAASPRGDVWLPWRGTAAEWAADSATVLEVGEPGMVTDTGDMVYGDGVSVASSLVTGNLVGASTWSPMTETVSTVAASGSTETIPAPTVASISLVTLTAACTLSFPTPVAGQSLTVVLVQDGTGSRTVTWPETVTWPGGTAPTLTTTAAGVDWLTFACADGATWAGFTAGLDLQ